MRTSAAFILFAAAGCAAPGPPTPELAAFRFEGKPIHPAILDEFIPWISDGEPVVMAVDVEGFTRSGNRLCGWTVEVEDGWVKGAREETHEYLRYRYLGVDSKGALNLDVVAFGNGSASWRYLIQLRFETVQAFGSRRLLLRCENVIDLRCCPQGKVDPELLSEPCVRHPRPIPVTEPPDVPASGPALADPRMLGTWFPVGRYFEAKLGGFRLFAHSIFFERIGIVPFEVISESEGRCLLRLANDVESCLFLRIGPKNEFANLDVEVAFFRTLEDASVAGESGRNSAESSGDYMCSED